MIPLFTILKQYRHGLLAFLLLLTSLFFVISTKTESIGFRLAQESVLDVFGPVQKMLSVPLHLWHLMEDRLRAWQFLEEENQQLRQELAKLRPQRVYLEELLQENHRLRSLLHMNVGPFYRELAAHIVGDSSSAFARSMVIDAGHRDGVRENIPVVGLIGLMGRVVRAGERSALILTLQDLNSRVPVLVQRSRVRGIVVGNNSPLLGLDFIPKGADVAVDDLLITSGTGGVFPKGLVVGRIASISPKSEGLFQTIVVQPAVDFNRTEEVRLLLPADDLNGPTPTDNLVRETEKKPGKQASRI